MNGRMKLLIHRSAHLPTVPRPWPLTPQTIRPCVDRRFDVFENAERRFLVSQKLFAHYVLASNPKTVTALELSKPEL